MTRYMIDTQKSMDRARPKELTKQDLLIDIETTSESEASAPDDLPGRERARDALVMGLEMTAPGYNVFVMGSAGVGKTATIMKVLAEHRELKSPLKDVAVVYNYDRPDRPHALTFTAGLGKEFKNRMKTLLDDVEALVKSAGEYESFKKERDALISDLERREREELAAFERVIAKDGFKIKRNREKSDEPAAELIPIVEESETTFEEMGEALKQGLMDEALFSAKRGAYYGHMDELKKISSALRIGSLASRDKLVELRRELVEPALSAAIESIKSAFPGEKTADFLDETRCDMLANLDLFDEDEPTSEETVGEEEDVVSSGRYEVNLVTDNSEATERPVVIERNPCWSNLFGSVESKDLEGDFMRVRSGSLLRASGGFLILKSEDALGEDGVWHHLKRAMKFGETNIEASPSPLNPPVAMKVEGIPLDVKLIVTGNELLFDALHAGDREFRDLFKVLAEFDESVAKSAAALGAYKRVLIEEVCAKELLTPPSLDGANALMRYAVRLSGHKERLSCRVGAVVDLVRESAYLARKEGAQTIAKTHVDRALGLRDRFNELPKEYLLREMREKTLLVDVTGSAVGRVNALVVIDRGFHSFGCPVVVTASASAGRDGLLNIEREAGLSGETHDKGVMILEGFIRTRFARRGALGLNMSLCFEQTYDGVEGDSATMAETCALLSAIGNFPLKQNIAITGSMNQPGDAQPVGGASEKIMGFFDTCKALGFTGDQGVIIPARNVSNLFLSDEAIRAIDAGSFHIWPVFRVEEALSLLTGLTVGSAPGKRGYPKESAFGLVETEIRAMCGGNRVKSR